MDPVGSLHLTLRFLGDTPERLVAELRAALAAAAATSDPFDASLAGCGAFRDRSSPRAIWLGVDRGHDELGGLCAALDAELTQRGWPSEARPFRAHLTIARVEDPARGRAAIGALDVETLGLDAAWRVETLVLFESLLGRGPAHYEALGVARLGGERRG